MKNSLKVSMAVAGLLAAVGVVQTLHTESVSTAKSVSLALPAQSGSPVVKEPNETANAATPSTDGLVSGTGSSATTGPETEPNSESEPASAQSIAEKTPEQLLQEFVSSGDPQGVRRVFAERRKERAKLVKAKMNNQPVDMRWSDDLANRFEFARSLVPELAGLNLTQTDCRDTICAIHIAYADANYEQYQPFLQQVGIVLGGDAWVHHDALPGGGVIYVARDNQELPELKQL